MNTTFIAVVFILLSVAPLCAEESTSSSHVKKGLEQLKSGKYQTAIKTFEAAVKADPVCADAYTGIGEAYLGMGDNGFSSNPELIEKGVGNLRHALTINPNLAAAHYKLGIGYLALFDKDMALKEYEVLKRMDKGLADDLAARINKYKAQRKFRLTRSSGETGGTRANTAANKGASVPPSVTAAAKKERFTGTVELFITSWCPSCKRAIAYLQEQGIPYTAYDVEADAQAKKRFDELGGRGYPLILVGTNKFYGSNPKTIDYYIGR